VRAITGLTRPGHKATPAYRQLLDDLNRIVREFGVDNAVVMRRAADGRYSYVAIDHDGFDIGEFVHIHLLFPETYRATKDTWRAGEMMHSQLSGGRAGGEDYAQFVPINTALKLDGRVVAILMLNKFADPVAAAVRAKATGVIGLSAALIIIGLALFVLISVRMLRPLRVLTAAVGRVAQGDLDVAVQVPRRRDEVGGLARAFQGMVEGLRQRDFSRNTFGRYVSAEVAEAILGSPGCHRLGGDRREITLLVSDLRGFSVLADRLRAEEVIACLNWYFGRMVEILTRYRATIDEFQGDGVLAFFGAPLAAPDDAEPAVACALEMQRGLADLNSPERRQGLPELAMGIGIHTGTVIVGNIGSERRPKYGAVGTAVNLAYRIESLTVGGQVLLSPTTYARVRDVAVGETIEARLKGVSGTVTVYDVVALGGRYAASLPARPRTSLVALAPPLPVVCHPVEGAQVVDGGVAGQATRASPRMLEVRLAPVVRDWNALFETATGVAAFRWHDREAGADGSSPPSSPVPGRARS
jgi:class 3 adenylate cyclase